MKRDSGANLPQIELINSSKSEANDYLMRVGKKESIDHFTNGVLFNCIVLIGVFCRHLSLMRLKALWH